MQMQEEIERCSIVVNLDLPVVGTGCSLYIQFPAVDLWFPVNLSERHVLSNRALKIYRNRIRKTVDNVALIPRTKHCIKGTGLVIFV